jgi:hypothetical protein
VSGQAAWSDVVVGPAKATKSILRATSRVGSAARIAFTVDGGVRVRLAVSTVRVSEIPLKSTSFLHKTWSEPASQFGSRSDVTAYSMAVSPSPDDAKTETLNQRVSGSGGLAFLRPLQSSLPLDLSGFATSRVPPTILPKPPGGANSKGPQSSRVGYLAASPASRLTRLKASGDASPFRAVQEIEATLSQGGLDDNARAAERLPAYAADSIRSSRPGAD